MALSAKEKQKAYRIRQAKKNQVKAKVVAKKRDRRLSDVKQQEIEHDSLVDRCLHGRATEAEYNSLDKTYASYENGMCRIVGRSFGPINFTGDEALDAYNRVN